LCSDHFAGWLCLPMGDLLFGYMELGHPLIMFSIIM
jgi:hypothetical protein